MLLFMTVFLDARVSLDTASCGLWVLGCCAVPIMSQDGLHDVAAVHLAQRLTGLLHLRFDSANILTPGVLAVVAGLQSLKSFVLCCGPGCVVHDQQLQLLTGLTLLSRLFLNWHQCSEAGMQGLLAQLPCLHAVRGGRGAIIVVT